MTTVHTSVPETLTKESSAIPKKESSGVALLGKQLVKNLEHQPGWVPLLFLYYALLSSAERTQTFLTFRVSDHVEIMASLLTLVSYLVGDAIDKPLFKNFDGSWFDKKIRFVRCQRCLARKFFGVKSGIYRVALGVFTAAGAYEGSWTHLFNELAKCLRSLALPILALPLLPGKVPYGTFWMRLVLAAVVFVAYLLLKPFHMFLLYRTSLEKARTETVQAIGCKYRREPLGAEMWVYFWDGKLATSGLQRISIVRIV